MTNNLNSLGAQGMDYVFWALWDTAGTNYISGTDGTLASAADSGMGRALGVNDFSVSIPEAPLIDRPGDNGVIGSFIANPTSGPSGTAAYISFDQTFDTKATKRSIKAVGPHDISLSSNICYDFSPMFIVVNSRASSDESGSIGEAGWQVEEYLYVFVQPTSVSGKAINAAHNYTHRMIFNERGILPWGETITEDNYGLTKAWKSDPYWSPYPVYYHTYRGDGGAAQTFTLDKIPAEADGTHLQIWDNASALTYTTNFAVNTSTGLVTFVSTDPASGQYAVCKVLFSPDC